MYMKSLIASAVLLLAASVLAQAQPAKKPATNKLSDSYAIAALRGVIASENTDLDLDKIKANISAALDEMEAQVSSPADQKSFDALKLRFEGEMAYLNILKAQLNFEQATADMGVAVPPPGAKAMWAEDVAHRKSCEGSLKANLKQRDGVFPKECKQALSEKKGT